MTHSTMFLNNVTSVDHAYIGTDGWVHGNSYSPVFEVGGKVDPHENVVVDFSTVKKDIKKCIDDSSDGLDHKLWFIPGYSNGSIEFQNGRVLIETPHFKYYGAKDSVNVIPYTVFDESLITGSHVHKYLLKKYPDINIELKCKTDMAPTIPFKDVMEQRFHYTHGLKNSTSWGCQNMMHGHASFLVTDKPEKYDYKLDLLLTMIASAIDNKMFVWDENWFPKTKTINYESSDRGEFFLQFKDEVKVDQKIIVLSTETTVEHLADYVAQAWGSHLTDLGVKKVYVSEGQNKGAVAEL